MKEKSILNKVRELLGMEVKLEQRKLDDGITIIEAESFEPEMEVVVITEDDQRIPLPIGEYKMDDGMILVVTEEGIISEVKEEAKEEEEVVEEETVVEEEVEQKSEAPAKKLVESIVKETYFSEIETLTKENLELKSQLEKLSKVETITEEVKAEKEIELSTEDLDPAIKPISFNPENVQVQERFKISKGRNETTLDRVFRKLNK